MPVNTELASKQWVRYAWCRDNGHSEYVKKVDRCEAFFRGDQWDRADKAKLELVRRPALTINKIISTIANVMGEQIYNRAETAFRPRSGAPAATADVLTKVFKQISDNNQLDWKRSDMFADGIIGSRGYLDVRIGHNDSMQGEVIIENLNPKNVIPDPDGEQYDPDTWGEVWTTKWVTADDIAVMYGKEDAELLRGRDSAFPYGFDSVDAFRDSFGSRNSALYTGDYDHTNVQRNLRLLERQYRVLDRQKHFVSVDGDMRPVPETFDRDKIAWFVSQYGFKVVTKLVRRIKWTVTCDNVVLHDEWSPYKHFTVVPFFPFFRHGTTIGLVENLTGPQELLNKVSSQELHVVNTTANSGWKVKTGALTNMTPEELEEKGAQTGLVIEVSGDVKTDVEKIQPNVVPQGLDRISFKAEESIKTISGVNDSMQGFDREDVAAKAIQAKKQSGSTNLVKPLDSLTRSDFILARNTLDLIQEFYTEERLMSITHSGADGETENFTINQVTPEGEIINDLTLGEYGVVVTSVPQRQTLEDSQFEQATAMREMGVAIDDETMIENSRLQNKKELIRRIKGDVNSPEYKAEQERLARAKDAEVSKLEGEASAKHADARLKDAKTQQTLIEANQPAETSADTPGLDVAVAEHEATLRERELEHKEQIDFMDQARKDREHDDKMALEAQKMAGERVDRRLEVAAKAAAEAQKPTPTKGLR